MDHGVLSAFLLLLLVLDTFGALPIFVSAMSRVPPQRRVRLAPPGPMVFPLAVPLRAGPKRYLPSG